MKPLIINVSDISKIPGAKKKFDFCCELKPVYGAEKLNFIGPVHFNFNIENVDMKLNVKGKVCGKIGLICNRCLTKFERKVEVMLDEVFSSDKNELDEDEVFRIKNEKIDIGFVVEQAFLLSLPMKAVCSDECKGLCVKCGKNLNLGPCNCTKKEIDIRLLKLKEFKEKLEKRNN